MQAEEAGIDIPPHPSQAAASKSKKKANVWSEDESEADDESSGGTLGVQELQPTV